MLHGDRHAVVHYGTEQICGNSVLTNAPSALKDYFGPLLTRCVTLNTPPQNRQNVQRWPVVTRLKIERKGFHSAQLLFRTNTDNTDKNIAEFCFFVDQVSVCNKQ
jgi:hypothetical protein